MTGLCVGMVIKALSGCGSMLSGPPLQVVWNAAMLQSEDVLKAMQALMNKEQPVFSKL